MRIKHYIILLPSFLAAPLYGESEKLDTFDVEIEKAMTIIENTRLRLNATEALFDTSRAATKNQSKLNALEAARSWQSIAECRSVVREYQNFIQLSQIINEEEAKEAYRRLGDCYYKGQSFEKAFLFYRIYISSSLTTKDKREKDLLQVLERVFHIASTTNFLPHMEVSKLISSLTNLSDHREISAKIRLWSARLAEQFGLRSTAGDWYQSIYNNDELKDQSTKMLALYQDALLHFRKKESQEAKKLLKKAVQIADKNKGDTTLRLTMARIYVHDKQYKTALSHYDLITESSPDYAAALYEKIFIQLQLNLHQDAVKTVGIFQSKFPDRDEAILLKNLSAFFHLQAGEIEATQKKLKEIDKEYDSLTQWIITHLGYLDSVSQVTVNDLLDRSKGLVDTNSTIRIADELYHKMSRNDHEIAEARNDLRRLIYILGQANLETLYPQWSRKSDELKQISFDLLEASHRLVVSELNFLEPLMEEYDSKRLRNAIKKRIDLLSQASMKRFKKGTWVGWFNYENSIQSLNEKISSLHLAQAKLAANHTLLREKNKEFAHLKAENSQLISRLNEMERYTTKGYELARKSQIKIKMDLSELSSFKRFYMAYANSIFDEQKIMEKYREMDTRFAQNELKKRFQNAWSEWEYVAQLTFSKINSFEKSAEGHLLRNVKEIDDLLARYDRLHQALHDKRSFVEIFLARNINTIVRQYEVDLGEKRSRIKKWAGDLQWLDYDKAKSSQENLQKKYLLERELINESL